MLKIKRIFIALLIIFASANLWAKSVMIPLTSDWKYRNGDNVVWASPDALEGGYWIDVKLPGTLKGDSRGYFWLKTKVKIPSELLRQEVFLELGCATSSMEIFIDGKLMGRHGTMEPANVSHVSNTIVPIPSESVVNQTIDISIRCKCNADSTTLSQFFFINKERDIKTAIYQPLLNTSVYYMMAAVCFFLAFYFLMQFFMDKADKASIYFAMTLLFVSVYFFDMASDILIFPFAFQLGFARSCLLYSIAFLVIFLTKFFNRKLKPLVITCSVIVAIFTVLYLVSLKSAVFQETLFTLSLIPIFSGIIYIYVLLTKMTRKKERNAKIMLIGISIGMLFGVHDIVYQAMGKIPFAWLQGFAFFFIDMTMFVVVSVETIRNRRSVNSYAATTATQKDKLDSVIQSAVSLSKEIMEISTEMNESVNSVVSAVYDSANQTNQIGEFITKQNEAVKDTSDALSNLVNSVRNVTSEVNTETQVVDTTINETGFLINGVNQVAGVIENASSFSTNLGNLTQKTSSEVSDLIRIMEAIKNSSEEILGVVKVVSDFANKTNMLAMNASIEAAHSGAAGKGFTVIAHEIKKLAEASNNQATKINDIVTDINENIYNSFELSKTISNTLENVSKEAADTAASVSESVRSMEIQRQAGQRITEASKMMTESAGKVKKESDQQYAYSEQASDNMNTLAEVSSLTEQSVKDIIIKNQILSGQASKLQELAQRAQAASVEMNNIIRLD